LAQRVQEKALLSKESPAGGDFDDLDRELSGIVAEDVAYWHAADGVSR